MISVMVILLLICFVMTVLAVMGKTPLWIPLFVLIVIVALMIMPIK